MTRLPPAEIGLNNVLYALDISQDLDVDMLAPLGKRVHQLLPFIEARIDHGGNLVKCLLS